MTENFNRLATLLRELFQMDRPDLDFGIYRIMNQKRKDVSAFLENDLLPQVRKELSTINSGESVQVELNATIKQARELGADPEQLSKVQKLREQLATYGDSSAAENEIYSHLYNFFRRYYKDGDFLSLRRYKKDVYAIPYEGEEVKLHWANADQYYIKSAENFRDYAFMIGEAPTEDQEDTRKRVHFKLVDADTEVANNKAQEGKERRFMLCDDTPMLEENGELVIRFEYKPTAKKQNQKSLNEAAVKTILGNAAFVEWVRLLAQEDNGRSCLEKHLNIYTTRNTFDYFIHKDLGGFLRRELDFYIKNEVLFLDDIENQASAHVEAQLTQIRVLRRIAHKIIRFLEQIENFQKKLWLKKKFVVETNYLITLDRVPEELYPEIAANDAQREEWVRLFAIDEIKKELMTPGYSTPLSVEFLKAHDKLVLDTCFFDPKFRTRLLGSIDALDDQSDGLLIHSENFQALNILQKRYKDKIKCAYIDPPYNTGGDGFAYKDSYKHSSWLSLIKDRAILASYMLSQDGFSVVSIDDIEFSNINSLLDIVHGDNNHIANLVWDRNRKNDAKLFSVGHEYMTIYAKDRTYISELNITLREVKPGIEDAKKKFNSIIKKNQDTEHVKSEWKKYIQTIKDPETKSILSKFQKISQRGPYRDDGNINWPGKGGPKYEILHPQTRRTVKSPKSGWRYSTSKRFWEEYQKGKIAFGQDEKTVPGIIYYLFESTTQVMGSVFWSYAQSTYENFLAVIGDRSFENPKDVKDIQRIVSYLSSSNTIIIDYFAGSGTTGHAVININRENDGKQKYILIEMGEHFDTVLKLRMAKVVYCDSWKDGKPTTRHTGVSHCCKYLRLESYEDTLNNLVLKRTPAQLSLLADTPSLKEEYMLSYMMDLEAEGSASLLNVDTFTDPWNYTLKIATGSAGETRTRPVDLVETFNYLLGLNVIRRNVIRGIEVIEGINPEGEKVLIIWRNTTKVNNVQLDEFFRKQEFNPRDTEFHLIYVNGDNNLENLKRADETWKVRLTEEEFKRLMFDVEDV
ncbi:adenine-specific DNA-methyltransferase [Desulfomicrobium apsheronum]|uniref:site-specific DNA-methyltransferase (adenine-specific) n=1 Tax=Desulfomicrobium apsheronum TaxID=52560 RepID=A0A1I3V5V6_9BACT|nr:site-specific DNA-methyltransferase [Desulfomicrobium apsheronum]SFJ90665.1 adenine-specific DNA-methyltransferase [Desulfomicrobium apsheronum]